MQAVIERRKAIEAADKERKEAMLKKAQEREEKIDEKRRAHREANAHIFAFGSSTPRTLHPSLGASSTDLYAGSRSRSTSSSNMMTQSMYAGSTSGRKSVERGLDKNDGECFAMYLFNGDG